MGNEQETNKKTLDARIDDTTLQEMYLWPFAEGISVGAAGIMCSHNLVNGEHACESQTLLTEILKKGMGFRGYVVSNDLWNKQP